MARSDANVKMGVTGVAQFKNSMNQAKQAVKTLDTQLSLTEKEFKATGDAEAYMEKKTEELKAKLEAQKTVVDNAQKALDQMAKNGVDRSSKAYQDMYREMLKAKGELLDTETALGNIGVAAGEADEGVTDLNTSLQQIGAGIDYQNVTTALDNITGGMETVMKKAFELGRRLYNFTLGGGAWADELTVTAQNFGISPEELLRMQKTADIIDTDAETILQAKAKMQKVIGQDLIKDGSGVADMLEVLGLTNIIDTDPEEMFWKIGEAIMQNGDAYTQEAAAQKLLGKSWRELIPLFEAGREEYEEVNKSWNTVNDDQIKQLTEMDDQYQKMQNEFDTLQQQFQATFAEVLTPILETVTGLLSEFNEYLQTEEGKEALKSLGDAVGSLFTDLTKVSPEDVITKIKDLLDKVVGGLKWISENNELVVGAVEAFVGAWAVLETAKGVTTVLQLINGIQGLTSGGAAAGAAAGASWGSAFASAVLKAAPWLLGLYEVLKPSEGGNDDLIDENGQLTELAKQAGFDVNGNGELIKPDTTYEYTIDALTPHGEYHTTGEAVDNTQKRLSAVRNGLPDLESATDKMNNTAEELTKTTQKQDISTEKMTEAAVQMQGLPTMVADAVRGLIGSLGVYLNGTELVGYVSDQLGGGIISD